MNLWIGRLLVTGFAVALVLIGLLLSLAAIARNRGVHPVAMPAPSLVEIQSPGADYLDAYRVVVPPGRFRDIEDVIAVAFQKGHEVGRNETEVVYQDCAPGLMFDVAYHLRPEGELSALTVTTVVHYTSWTGRVYFGLVRPFHRRLVPFMVSQMARRR